MTLPASGAISLSQVNVELGRSATASIDMNDAAVRALFGVGGSGTAISMSQGYGKSSQFAFTISANQTNANLRTLAVNAGWNQSSKVIATINGGIYISSNSIYTAALTISGPFPGGVELTNNGLIIGMGAAGGYGGSSTNQGSGNNAGTAGSTGGLALYALTGVTIRNNGTIGGGGGGGGGSGIGFATDPKNNLYPVGGGGGGGGRSSLAANSAGGPGGVFSPNNGSAGGVGTYLGQGAGGAGYRQGGTGSYPGGNGGGWGSAGIAGVRGDNGAAGGAGGPGGFAISGNSNISWAAFGTRLGGIA